MYRKIALTSVGLNIALVYGTLVFILPRMMDLFKNLKVEMPMPIMWLINASHFVTHPVTGSLTLLVLAFVLVKLFRRPEKMVG